ncbi:FAD-dependent monooxygenase [Nocardia terpenica]|uniref:FAD-dependent monooxygenase n=1 Tax=Nocardia terpenica TaxID=455432 RepID=UPI001894A488|nr:FAD-dependent monooxygenase [Nocardia terpenica]MBF6061560.1 FAD-dependent monooxygenase [Nocardia terpenica]MBF6107645.1 FAD-dependent monooxygenase [Nocardia terpenica]MBF6109980.1 FAD-dependent monooxygenase [Nocardia terpenica]MBF6122508.1 FAD-dependent monooxygenase [Nocardia terpenica]MBF6151316.1 FAD-dependent monooxygenase [Nocardia terpenica]
MTENIVIVGAGPVGMLLACELLERGTPVRIVDDVRLHTAHSRATVIWPRLLELMHHTGITERLVEAGHRADGVSFYSRRRRLGTAWVNRLPDLPYPFAVTIAQSETERIIEARLTELGGKVERGVRLTGIRNPGGEWVGLTLESHDGTCEEVETSWLVGADGAHSTVRKLLGASFDGMQFDVSFAVTDAVLSGDAPANVLSYCYAPEGSLALVPMAGQVSRIAISIPHAPEGTEPPREFYQRVIDERAPGRNVVGDMRFSAVFRVHARATTRFRYGRCLLIGDAAHIMSPASAQGMNTGMQDAAALGWRLHAITAGWLPESALTDYDLDRRPAAEAVVRATTIQTKLGIASTRSAILLRDTAVRAADRTGLFQRALAPMLAQTNVRYPTADPHGGPADRKARHGRRIPALPAGPAARITEHPSVTVDGTAWPALATDRPTVVLWPGRRPPLGWDRVCAQIRTLVGDRAAVITPTARGPLSTALGRSPTIALIRPDGHLFTRIAPEDAIRITTALEDFTLRTGR